MDRKTGARGLRSIMEKTLMDVMFRDAFRQYDQKLYHYRRCGRRKDSSGAFPRGATQRCSAGRAEKRKAGPATA